MAYITPLGLGQRKVCTFILLCSSHMLFYLPQNIFSTSNIAHEIWKYAREGKVFVILIKNLAVNDTTKEMNIITP